MAVLRARTSGIRRVMGRGALLAALPLLATSAALTQSAAGPVVAVTGGQVQGRPLAAPGGAVFKGIPYGAPPVGPLRWRETQPVRPWTGVVQADAFRPGCGQSPEGQNSARGSVEDCLYLNVWAPEWPARTKKPVMLWINGGELAGGSGALRAGAESLARNGVVLVSANYRGTLLGMMGHPELTAENPHKAAGGFGHDDEVAILRWIHANIARFGGDPANVTIFGQSGGAHVISMLLTSPLTKGLIHKAIIHSGPPFQPIRPYLRKDEIERIGVVTGELLGAPKTGTIAWLRSRPAADIVAAMPAVRTHLLEKYDGAAYDQGVDGYTVPLPPNELWFANKEHAIPVMIGSTLNDTSAVIAGEPPLEANATPEAQREWQKRLLAIVYGADKDLLAQAEKAYGLDRELSSDPLGGSAVLPMTVDLNHRCASGMAAALHSKVAPTWLYEFTRATPGHPPTHSSDLRYVFGTDDLEDAATREQSRIMQRYWTNFAKTGNPNGAGLTEWAKYDPATKPSIEFAFNGPVARARLREAECAPLIEKYTRHPKLLSSGENLRFRGSGGAR